MINLYAPTKSKFAPINPKFLEIAAKHGWTAGYSVEDAVADRISADLAEFFKTQSISKLQTIARHLRKNAPDFSYEAGLADLVAGYMTVNKLWLI